MGESLTSSGLTLTLATGAGALFPSPGLNESFALGLTDSATKTLTEIVYCTNVTGDVLTVVRAQEGTTALNWSIGDLVSNNMTAGTASNFLQQSLLGNFILSNNSNKLYISYGSANIASIDNSGNMIISGTLTESGTP